MRGYVQVYMGIYSDYGNPDLSFRVLRGDLGVWCGV